MTYSDSSNQFDPIETDRAIREHADAYEAYQRMMAHELRQTAGGNKWGCSEKARYTHAVTKLMELGKSVQDIKRLEEGI